MEDPRRRNHHIDLGSRSIGGNADIGIDVSGGGGRGNGGGELTHRYSNCEQQRAPWVQLATFELSGNRLLLNYYDGDRKTVGTGNKHRRGLGVG